LLVDADRVLPSPVAPESFKVVAWKSREIGKGNGCIQYLQSFPSLPVKTLERSYELAPCEKLGAFVFEVQDHRAGNLFACTMYVKRKYRRPAAADFGCPGRRRHWPRQIPLGNFALTMISVW
jgi:hypothetical protein